MIGAAEPGLAEKVAWLSTPDAYPGAATVETIETHMSFVFLADGDAFKLKKPVRNEWLDFSTPAKRRHFCEEEVRLNRRFSPDVYRGTVPLVQTRSGALVLDGAGRRVDTLVHMRRLPADATVARAIERERLTPGDVDTIAGRFATFARAALCAERDPDRYRARLSAELEGDRAALLDLALGMDPPTVDRAVAPLRRFLETRARLLDERVTGHWIVEGHGDLRAEHVFLVDHAPVLIDCVEFRRAFRILDPVDELAFLSLDCERLGAAWVRPILFRAWGDTLGDVPSPELVDFHAARRALLRAKLALQHLKDPAPKHPDVWRARGLEFLSLALLHGSPRHEAEPASAAASEE